MKINSLLSLRLLSLLAIIVLTGTPACSKKKNSRNSSGSAGPEEGAEDPDGEVEPEPVPADPDIGEDVPPVGDDVVVVESGDVATVKHLIFQAGTAREEQRYLSEYLLIVRANSESCIRLKVRPSSGIDSEVPDEVINGLEDVGACEAYPEAQQPAPDPAAGAKLTNIDYGAEKTGFALAATPAVLCDLRLFRMPSGESTELGQPSGLGPIVTKTARLGAIGPAKKVRIWIDDEIGNICSGGAVANMQMTDFGPLAQTRPDTYSGHKDQLTLAHLANIAAETERLLGALTTNYGDVSDIDQTGSIEVFITPDVNRQFFVPSRTTTIDQFQVNLIDKPEDLANYNATTNPTSNEGEVVYLWAPDPAGIYNYGIYPSSNSLTSNYAKGYIGTQVMNLINNNSHLLTLKDKVEESWLRESLALLASSYVAGNDYTGVSLAHYLASRSQGLSLTGDISGSVAKEYIPYEREGQIGLRTMFGWFLHSKLCASQAVTPCPKIKELIATPKVGIANIEAVTGESFGKVLEQFGVSVGVSLVDNPTSATALLKANADSIDPIAMPKLAFILGATPPKTYMITLDAASGSTVNDPALAGPFPSKDSMLFQPILPDSDMDIKMEKDTVTYIMLTGIINAETDITAYLGPNLNVTIVPLADRNGAVRRMHFEKVSEAAHLDLRPTNLTDTVDPTRTNFGPSSHAGIPFTVDNNREIWMIGSLDNFNVNQEGSPATIGDTDSYTIEVDPCAGATGAKLTTCQGRPYSKVLIQVISRDYHKNLTPVLYSTLNSASLFRGKSMWGLLNEIDPDFELPADNEIEIIPVLCQSEFPVAQDLATANNCANGGITAAAYLGICTAYTEDGICEGGLQNQATTFDKYGFDTNTIRGPSYDNYFHLGGLGYPYYTHGMMFYDDMTIRLGIRNFTKEEVNRQFFNFSYIKNLGLNSFYFYPTMSGFYDPIQALGADTDQSVYIDFDSKYKILSDDEIEGLLELKSRIDTETIPGQGSDAETILLTQCGLLDISELNCLASATPAGAQALEVLVKAAVEKLNVKVLCRPTQAIGSGGACDGKGLAVPGTSPVLTAKSTAWIPANRIIEYHDETPSNRLLTYYDPTFLDYRPSVAGQADLEGCSGMVSGQETLAPCKIQSKFMRSGDIRTQLNVPASKIYASGCSTYGSKADTIFLDDFHACGDYYSFKYSAAGEATEDGIPTTLRDQMIPEALARDRPMYMGMQAGELLGFLARTHYQIYKIPSTGPTKIHIMLGGLNRSQGKYLLRVRVQDFRDPVDKR